MLFLLLLLAWVYAHCSSLCTLAHTDLSYCLQVLPFLWSLWLLIFWELTVCALHTAGCSLFNFKPLTITALLLLRGQDWWTEAREENFKDMKWRETAEESDHVEKRERMEREKNGWW